MEYQSKMLVVLLGVAVEEEVGEGLG